MEMTQREKELYEIIREDPMISQNEIAAKMNVTRSAVSVFLNSMTKKGILAGRGYILNEPTYPVVIGPGHVDIRNVSQEGGRASTSFFQAVKSRLNYGGAAKNTCDFLVNFSIQPRAIFIVGDDDLGHSFLDACRRAGLPAETSILLPDSSTAIYIELIDQDHSFVMSSFAADGGEKAVANIAPAHLLPHRSLFYSANMILLHDSLPVDIMRYLRTTYPDKPLFLIGSMSNYTMAQEEVLSAFYSSIMSLSIAASAAWQKPVEEVVDPSVLPDVCTILARKGMRNFFIMADSYTLAYCNGEEIIIHTSDNPVPAVEGNFSHYYSDCRDIASATICYGGINHIPPLQILDYLAAARNLSQSPEFYFVRTPSISALNEVSETLHPQVKVIPLRKVL